MFDYDELFSTDFKITDGLLRDRHGYSVPGCISVREFGWSNPCTEYVFDNSAVSAYTIYHQDTAISDEWWLKKNGQLFCQLRHLGGLNWEKY